MKTVNIQEAKTHLSRLVQEAAEGEDIVIAKAGRPMVRLTPVSTLEGPRHLGALAGRVVEAENCWARDAAIEEMYGSAVEPGGTRGHPQQLATRDPLLSQYEVPILTV